MAGSIEKLCDSMETACVKWSLGYDQGNRWDVRDGGECDCSSLTIWALKQAGFDVGSATYTGNISANLTARGWKRIANDGNPKRGDILLNDRSHVAVYLGNGKLAQASIDEHGNIVGGKAGDQTGRETNVSNYYNFPWDCYLRYAGAGSGSTTSTASTASKVDEVRYRASVDPNGKKWLNEYVGFSSKNDSDGFAGIKGQPMRWLAMKFPGWYQVKTEKGGWLGKVRAYNINDLDKGCAGDGSPIVAIRCYYETQNPSKTGYHVIEYQAGVAGGGWLGYLHDLKCVDGDSDNFAGNGKRIDRFKARIVKA